MARSAAAAGTGKASPDKAAPTAPRQRFTKVTAIRTCIIGIALGRSECQTLEDGLDYTATAFTLAAPATFARGGRDFMTLRLTTILNRREFSGLCAAAGASVMASKASALDPAPGGAPGDAKRTVTLRDGLLAPPFDH